MEDVKNVGKDQKRTEKTETAQHTATF